MKLRELLHKLQRVRKKIDVSEAFLCGGVPRDKLMVRIDHVSDMDITNGDKSIAYLSSEFAAELGKQYDITRKEMSDGHSTIFVGNLKMDFSSNFNIEGIENILAKMEIANPTDMQKEIYSRDFTCNALLLSIDLKNLIDPTKRGFQDIKERVIRTCLDPQITLTSNKNRVVRAIYLAAKLGFDVDPEIIAFVRKNPQTVKISTDKVMQEKLAEAFKRDADKASHVITQMGLWNYIPISRAIYPYYLKAKSKTNAT